MPELKPTVFVSIVLAALVGGMAGAGATWALSGQKGDAKGNKAKPATSVGAAEDSADADALAFRLDRLEADLRALRKRNQSTDALRQYAKALNQDSARKPVVAGGDGADSADADAAADDDGVVDAEDPSFELAVRTVLDRVDWEREEERRVTQTKRREERAQRQTELLAERLKLSAPQTQKVQQILTQQMETFRSLREGDDSNTPRPTTRSEWRARVEAIRTETERKLSEVLDNEQMSSYHKFVEEEGFGPGSGRGRRGGQQGNRAQP